MSIETRFFSLLDDSPLSRNEDFWKLFAAELVIRSNCTQNQSCRAFQGLSIGIKIMKIRTKPIHLIRVKDDPFASTGTKDWNHVFPRKIKCSGFLTKLEERGGCSAFVGNYAEGSDTRSHAEGGKTWLSSWTRVRGAQFFQNFFIIWPQLRPPDLRSAWETQKKLEIFFKTPLLLKQ